jgi:hypothetical protein
MSPRGLLCPLGLTTRCLLLAMATLLAVVPATANAQSPQLPQHTVLNSKHYRIVTDLPRQEIRELAAHMDAMYAAYSKMFSGFPKRTTEPVSLYLWSDRNTYIAHGASMGSDWGPSGGVFFRSGAGNGVSTWVRDQSKPWLRQLLQHEGFHQFAHYHLGPTLPLWANEGLAVYFEHGLLVNGKLIQGMAPKHRIDLLQQAIQNGRHFSVQELMGMTSAGWWDVMRGGDGRAGIMYTQAWSLVHFLIHGNNGRYKDAFEDYLREIAKGATHDVAFRAAFKTSDTEAFERRWAEYVAQLQPDPLGEATDKLEFMANGLLYLRRGGVNVTSVVDLQHELQRRNYRVARVIDGVRHEVAATNEMFQPPAAGGAGKRRGPQPTIEALPGEVRKDGFQFPPTFVIRGLRATVSVAWSIDPSGELSYEIVYQ